MQMPEIDDLISIALNPERDTIVTKHSGGIDKQPVAA
jgi:hypothetical protein